jgi:hypothetical protein
MGESWESFPLSRRLQPARRCPPRGGRADPHWYNRPSTTDTDVGGSRSAHGKPLMTPLRRHRFWPHMFPELFLFPEARQARRALWRAFKYLLFYPGYWLYFALTTAAFYYARKWVQTTSWNDRLVINGMVLAWCLVLSEGALWYFRGGIAHSLRQDLHECGVRVCMSCGYDLCGQLELRCPECGKPFPREWLDNPHKRGDAPSRGPPLHGPPHVDGRVDPR